MISPLSEWIRVQGERVIVSDAVDPVNDASSATCGAADRTIVATSAIVKGDVIVALQEGAFLNGSQWVFQQASTSTSDLTTQLEARLAKLQPSGSVLTSLALLAEKSRGESSAFYGYIQQLPSTVPLPLAWSSAGKALLLDTAAYPIMDDELVQSVFQRFATPLASEFSELWSSGVSLDDFRWAFSIVSSRAFSVNETREPTLLPVIDMANHDPSHAAAGIHKDENGYSLVALRDIDAGTVVTISYGDLSNAQLLCRYGFTLPTVTPFDTVLISSTHVHAVYAQLMNGGNVDDALAQLDRVVQDEAAAVHGDEKETTPDDGREEPVVKRRKLFERRAAADPVVVFALHGDATQEFGLADGLMDFVLAQHLPMDTLYDVLTVLLQHKDRRLSVVLGMEETNTEVRLAQTLAARERELGRRILLNIMSLEEDSTEEDETE